jgi:aspartyl-tRNA(Asn)/glutamyl-tRNA(Gln) amidotransferase subunit A
MIDDELCYLSIADIAARYRNRTLSPIELVDAYLTQISNLNSKLNCYVAIFAERARADAIEAEQAFARGEDRGPLHGVPLALKDLFDMTGLPAGANTRVLEGRTSNKDAALIIRLRDAGAVLLGKLQLHEFAMATPRLDDPIPPARNPWDVDRMPGGSSSGSASALAAGLCAGSFGSDTGGSIRHPASHNAVVGLKPTYGLISRRGAIALSWSMDHVGPMARRVEDTALLLQAAAGFDSKDPGSAQVTIPNYQKALTGSIRGLRIGVPRMFIESVTQHEIVVLFYEAMDVFLKLGAEIKEIELPSLEHSGSVFLTILLSEAVVYHEDWLRHRAERYGRDMWLRLLPGLGFPASDYLQAQRGRAMICREINDAMKSLDIIATPTMPQLAPRFTDMLDAPPVPRSPLTRVANITGQPSLSLPCGFLSGLPVGLLLNGRAFEEDKVLRAADAFERATDWHRRRPTL